MPLLLSGFPDPSSSLPPTGTREGPSRQLISHPAPVDWQPGWAGSSSVVSWAISPALPVLIFLVFVPDRSSLEMLLCPHPPAPASFFTTPLSATQAHPCGHRAGIGGAVEGAHLFQAGGPHLSPLHPTGVPPPGAQAGAVPAAAAGAAARLGVPPPPVTPAAAGRGRGWPRPLDHPPWRWPCWFCCLFNCFLMIPFLYLNSECWDTTEVSY